MELFRKNLNMFYKFLCKIGIHDYSYILEPKLKNNIRKEMGLEKVFYGYNGNSLFCGIKICLKCNKVIDTLNSTILELEIEKKEIEKKEIEKKKKKKMK